MTRHDEVVGTHAATHQSLPRSVHDADAGATTVDAEVFNNITKNSFVSFSGLSKHGILAAWTVALEYNKTNDVHMIGLVWQSALALVGGVLQHKHAIAALVCCLQGSI